jgi:hypothetical protein
MLDFLAEGLKAALGENDNGRSLSDNLADTAVAVACVGIVAVVGLYIYLKGK